jgi:hypothetical protein
MHLYLSRGIPMKRRVLIEEQEEASVYSAGAVGWYTCAQVISWLCNPSLEPFAKPALGPTA